MEEEKPTSHNDNDIPELIYGEEEEEYPIFAMIGVTLLIVVAILLFVP